MRIENPNRYPRAYAVLRDIKNLCLGNSQVWNSFHRYSTFSRSEAGHILSLGTRPDIILVINLESKQGNTSYGVFDATFSTQAIRVRENIMMGLEIAKLEKTIYGTAFFLSVTILHELVHYCRNQKQIPKDEWEYGVGFEREAFGGTIELDNIGNRYLQFKKSYENLHGVLQKTKKRV